MKGLVILEGADSSGKSTLAKRLVRRYGAVNFACSISDEMVRHHADTLRAAIDVRERGGLAVCDRMWVSELVYGPIFRGREYADSIAEKFDRQIIEAGGVYILCVPRDIRTHLARFEASRIAGREEFDRVEEVAVRYRDLVDGNVAHPGENLVDRFIRFGDFAEKRKVIRYDLDVDGKDLDAFARRIERALRGESK